MKKLWVYGMTCALSLAAGTARATTIVLPTDEQLIAKSPVIVDGTVLSTNVVDRDGTIWTDTQIEVARAIKGSVADTITVREIGGVLEDRITRLYGTPEFAPGEQVLLFLEQAPHGGYRTIDLYVGKFTRGEMRNGQQLWMRNDVASDVLLLDVDFQPLHAKNVQRDAVGFETFVRERVAGRSGVRNYGVENPILARDVKSEHGGVSSDFTLISEPTISRWFFSDGAAKWYSANTQPGYTDGGVSELRTAMQAWTGYAAANIDYSYSGSRSGAMGGLSSQNGINEVLFNDPLDEISGTWNRNTGGVVGRGGYNGVSSRQSFTATFAADASHPAGTLLAWTITEGNLVIQDGVSPSAGIGSKALAEIVAHEFGHTLGFGHSSDSSALMYSTVTGIGPSLRNDDQIAARWLYPAGGAPPPPPPSTPAAPSALTAHVTASNIDLSWLDHASNETGFSIYLAVGTVGAFSKVTNVNANVTTARLSGLAPGSYRIYVLAYNASGNSSQSNTATATIAAATTKPTASFNVSTQSPQVGQSVAFSDTSTGSPTAWAWTFGDGTTSSVRNPLHAYPTAGTYTAKLTASNASGSTAATKTITVSVATPVVNASFTASNATPQAGQSVTFTDTSSGSPTAWAWTFGDGATSAARNPIHAFATAGVYSVKLTASNAKGSSSVSQTIAVASSPITPTVVASFDVSTQSAQIGQSLTFTDTSSGSPTAWSWSFGDGAVSSARNPVHAYAGPGRYTVTLNASKGGGSASASKSITVSSIVPYRALVSVATYGGGVGGTSWRTELNLFNAGTQGASVSLVFIPTSGGNMITRNLFLGPHQLATYANSLFDLFGIASGAGALGIEATSAGASADLRVSSRTFTTGTTGTYGQSVPDVQPEGLEKTLYITGIAANDDFRTNVGLVNRGSATMNATITLYSRSGTVLSIKNVTLNANTFQQAPLAAYFPEISGTSQDVLTMRIVAASSDAISAYASVVDNLTQDPIYIQARSAEPGNSLTIPVAARASGANGTFWRSDLTFFNTSTSASTLTLRYGNATRTLFVGGNDTAVVADVLSTFGVSSGSGALRVSWTSPVGPVATSRTYTSVATGGTYGQSIDPVAGFGSRLFVPGLRNDGSYRSNIGFVNGGSETEFFTVTLLSPSGTELARNHVTLTPGQQMQTSVTALFPNASLPAGFTLQAEGDSNAKLFAYGSMVDNASGDPVFFAGR